MLISIHIFSKIFFPNVFGWGMDPFGFFHLYIKGPKIEALISSFGGGRVMEEERKRKFV